MTNLLWDPQQRGPIRTMRGDIRRARKKLGMSARQFKKARRAHREKKEREALKNGASLVTPPE